MSALTQRAMKYRVGNARCPVCNGEGCTEGGDDVTFHGYTVTARGSCSICGATWTEEYTLLGVVVDEKACDHDGFVNKGRCERCGETGLESDSETYAQEAPL